MHGTSKEKSPARAQKPRWLNKKVNLGDCDNVKRLLSGLRLHTVCREASCPNIGECFARKEATFLILGNICTRACKFCGVAKGSPLAPDADEPERVAEAVARLGLSHAVITSVTRDDLPDGGSGIFARTVRAIRERSKDTAIEVLIPDFQSNKDSLETVVRAKPDIIGHNLETVSALYPFVRQGAKYASSLELLRTIKEFGTLIYTKSGLMLGLGETEAEVLDVLSDLGRVACDFLSIGQYLSPGESHYPVKEYISPQQFEYYKHKALACGLRHVESGPYVRSSYMASEYLQKREREGLS